MTSFTTFALQTYSANNSVQVSSVANMVSGVPITFAGSAFGNIAPGANYYVGNITSVNTITITTLPGGAVWPLANATGNMTATFTGGGQEVINTGSMPDDGTGSPLRTAFTDTNVNFDQIFAAGPVGSNVRIINNTILTTNTNGNLVLNPNGIGAVVANAHVIPDTTNIRNLGSQAKRFATVYTQYLDVNQFTNLTISTANLHITGGSNGYVLQTDGTGNLTWTAQTGGGGNGVPGGANTQIQFNNAGVFGGDSKFTFDGSNVEIVGAAFIANPGAYTLEVHGLSAYMGSVADGGIGVDNNVTTISTPLTLAYGALSASGTVTASNYVGGSLQNPDTVTTIFANPSNVVINPSSYPFGASWTFDRSGSLTVPGLYEDTTGLITAEPQKGLTLQTQAEYNVVGSFANGSGYSTATNVATTGGTGTGLTVDITASSGSVTSIVINNPGTGYSNDDTILVIGGDNNCDFVLENPNPFTNSATFPWLFGINGQLTTPGETWIRSGDSYNSIVFTPDGTTDNGHIKVDGGTNMGINSAANFYVKRAGQDRIAVTDTTADFMAATNVRIQSNKSGSASTWTFDTAGELTTPQGGRLGSAGKGWQGLDGGNGNPVSFTSFYANGFYAGCLTAYPDGNIAITTYTGDGAQGLWQFDNTGNLSASGNITATSFVLASAGGNTVSVIRQNQNPPAGSEPFGIELSTLSDTPGIYSSVSAGPDYVTLNSSNGGNANVTLQGGYGVTVSTTDPAGGNEKEWTFGIDGKLTLPGGGTITSALGSPQQGLWLSYNGHSLLLNNDGQFWTGGIELGGNALPGYVGSYSNITLDTNIGNSPGDSKWVFDTTGNLTLPTGGNLIVASGTITGDGASPAPSINGFDTISAIKFSASGNINGHQLSLNANTGNILTAVERITADGFAQPVNSSGVMLQVTGQTGVPTRFTLDGANSYVTYVNRVYGGTPTAPTGVAANTLITRFGANPYTSTGWLSNSTARIDMWTTETQTTTARGSQIVFATIPNGSNVIANIATMNSTGVSVAGNVYGNYFVTPATVVNGNISTAGNITGNAGLYITGAVSAGGNVRGANINTAGIVTASGNVYGNNISTTGNLVIANGRVDLNSYGTPTINSIGYGIAGPTSSLNIQAGPNQNIALYTLNSFYSWKFDQTGNLTAPGNVTAAGNVYANYFVGNISITGNVVGTSPNVQLVAGSYTYTFDNTGNVTLPTNGDLIFSANTTMTSLSNGNITIDPNGTGQLIVTAITPAQFGNTVSVAGNITTSGKFIGDGSALANVATKSSGSWTLATGTNTVSFTVTAGRTYSMWVSGNIPNGIVVWNATATLTNTNVPVIGQQFGWYYSAGNALVLTSMPSQIIGTAGSISTASPAVANTNVFNFTIVNNSGSSQTVYYGWTQIS